MIKFELSQMINRPVEEVFALAADMEKRPQWMSSVEETHWTSEGPRGVGSTFRTVRRMPGRRIEDECEFTEYEPNSKYSYKQIRGHMESMELRATFEPLEGGTRYSIVAEAELTGLWKLAGPVLGPLLKRGLSADLRNLARQLEAQAKG